MTVFIASVGRTKFGRREEGLVDLLAEAARNALEGAPSALRQPEGLFVGTMLQGEIAGEENILPKLAEALGLGEAAGYRVDCASATGAAAFQAAATAVASGRIASALVVAGEKMSSAPLEAVTTALSYSLSEAEVHHGATMPSMAALVSSEYLRAYSLPAEEVGLITVMNREAAVKNPFAHFKKTVTLEEVNSSRMISQPLRLLHVSAVSDGAAASLLTREHQGISVAGMGQGTDRVDVVSRGSLTSFKATRLAAKRAYEEAHLTRKDIGTAEVHDAFAPFELIDLEDLGFCGPGEALTWLKKGNGSPSGTLPVNPSGGLLGRGHPVGASGLIQIVETCLQLSGEAGAVQAGSPKVGLTQSVGGLGSHNFVTILERK